MPHSSATFPETTPSGMPPSRTCKRLMDLGYVAGKRVNLYGESFEIASDPFVDDEWVAIRVTSKDDPTIRTIRLPVSILVGLTDLAPQHEGYSTLDIQATK